jgi:hypothetical protein
MDLQLIISRLPLNFLPRKGGGDGFVSGTDSLPIMNEGMEMIILSAPPLSTVLRVETTQVSPPSQWFTPLQQIAAMTEHKKRERRPVLVVNVRAHVLFEEER